MIFNFILPFFHRFGYNERKKQEDRNMLTFRTEQISPRIIRIFAFCGELAYLVLGDKKAALLDTGSGIGSLKACVDALTDLPVTVLITHGHVDHAMGAGEFEDIYMNRLDDYIYCPHADPDFRKAGLSMLLPEVRATEDDLIPAPPADRFQDLRGGDCFDLGGVHIDVYNCPGHTRGSVVFLIREERTLLLGDACNEFTFLFDRYSTTITEYRSSLEALLSQVAGSYDHVLLSHGDGKGFPDQIQGVMGVCDDILAGRTADIPFRFQGRTALIAKVPTPGQRREDGSCGNIVYNKDRI